MTRQAIQMGLMPALPESCRPRATRPAKSIFPTANWLLMVGTLVGRDHVPDVPTALASAYGIAVSGTMLVTTMLLYHVMVGDLALAARSSPALVIAAVRRHRGDLPRFQFAEDSSRAAGSRCWSAR